MKSWFGSILGSTSRSSNHQISSKRVDQQTNESLHGVNDSIELLEKRQRLLEKKIEEEHNKAKMYLTQKNKPAATRCLKMKKQYEAQLQKISAQILNLSSITVTLENASMDVQVVTSMSQGGKQLNQMYNELGGIEKVENIVEETKDTIEKTNRLGEALSQSISDPLDEDDLEDEFNLLVEAQNLAISVPKDKPSKQKKVSPKEEFEKDLEQFVAELS